MNFLIPFHDKQLGFRPHHSAVDALALEGLRRITRNILMTLGVYCWI